MILKKGYAYLGKCSISSKLQIVCPELSLCSQPIPSQGQNHLAGETTANRFRRLEPTSQKKTKEALV